MKSFKTYIEVFNQEVVSMGQNAFAFMMLSGGVGLLAFFFNSLDYPVQLSGNQVNGFFLIFLGLNALLLVATEPNELPIDDKSIQIYFWKLAASFAIWKFLEIQDLSICKSVGWAFLKDGLLGVSDLHQDGSLIFLNCHIFVLTFYFMSILQTFRNIYCLSASYAS